MAAVFADVVLDILRRASTDLFVSAGLRLDLQSGDHVVSSDDDLVGALVRFTGEKMKGSLALISTFELIARARPRDLQKVALSTQRASDWVLVRDWAGELTNQLMGRLKNRLTAQLTTAGPFAASGRAVRVAIPKTHRTRSVVLAKGSDVVQIRLDLVADPSLDTLPPPTATEEGAREGDVILF